MKNIFTLIIAFYFSLAAFAQQGGNQASQTISNFSLAQESGKTVSLSDYSSSKAVVVIFVNNNCPNSRLYEKRLSSLAATYANQGVSFIFITPAISMEQGETPEKVTAALANLTIVPDDRQKVSQQFGATKTPEAFLLQPVNGSFTVKYTGAIDDNPQLESGVKQAYLRHALDAVLTNQTIPVTEKHATGCMIKRF